MSRKEWVVVGGDRAAAQSIAEECGIDPLAALLLLGRGISDPAGAEEFLDCDQQLADPFEIRDMDRAVARIRRAVSYTHLYKTQRG